MLVLALLAVASPASGQQVGTDVPATSSAGIQNEPQVAAFGNTLVAVWYRDADIRYSGWGLSLDGGGSWTDGGGFPLADPDRDGIFGQLTVCVDHTGRFYAATVYSAAGEGVALYRGTPQAGSLSWDAPLYALAPTLIEYDLPRALDAPRLTCDPERGYLYLSYTRSQAPASGPFEYTIQFVRSLDGGTTWSAPQVLSGTPCNGSRPAVGPDGEVYVVWEDFAARQVVGRRSADFGASFGPSFVVGAIRDNLGTAPPGWQPPNWRRNPLYLTNQNKASDFPSLAVDRGSGPYRGRTYVAWTDYAEAPVGPASGYSYDAEPNGSFASATPVAIGDNISGYTQSPDFGPGDGDWFTFTGSAGTTIQISGRVTSIFPSPSRPRELLYDLVCGEDTLQHTIVAVNFLPLAGPSPPPPIIYTLPADGRYYLRTGSGDQYSYNYEFSLREVSPLGGQAAQDHRDMVLTWSDDGGATWAARRRVSDAAPRYDESFPAVAVDELGRVHLAWYDRRDDPTCGELANTYWTFSTDGGASFVAARRLSSQGSSWAFFNPNHDSNIGDHLGLTTAGGRVHVLWTDTRGADADIYAVRIEDFPTGIAVPRFTAEVKEGHVRLAWRVADATGITGFRLHRAEGGSEGFAPLGEEPRPSTGPGDYQAEDRAVLPGQAYRYRLEVVREGASDWEGPVAVALPLAITRLAWQGASPNPFARSVRMELAVPRAGEAWVRVYDLTGHEVATLHGGAVSPGVKSFTWDGHDQAGRRVAAGVYLVRADLAGESAIRRVVRIQ